MDEVQKAELKLRITCLLYAAWAFEKQLISPSKLESAEDAIVHFVETLL
jgi:hypothetical protein